MFADVRPAKARKTMHICRSSLASIMGKGVTVVLVRVASYLARKSTEKHRVHNLLKKIDSTGASFPQAGGTPRRRPAEKRKCGNKPRPLPRTLKVLSFFHSSFLFLSFAPRQNQSPGRETVLISKEKLTGLARTESIIDSNKDKRTLTNNKLVDPTPLTIPPPLLLLLLLPPFKPLPQQKPNRLKRGTKLL